MVRVWLWVELIGKWGNEVYGWGDWVVHTYSIYFSSVSGWWVLSMVYSMSDVNELVIACSVKVKLFN